MDKNDRAKIKDQTSQFKQRERINFPQNQKKQDSSGTSSQNKSFISQVSSVTGNYNPNVVSSKLLNSEELEEKQRPFHTEFLDDSFLNSGQNSQNHNQRYQTEYIDDMNFMGNRKKNGSNDVRFPTMLLQDDTSPLNKSQQKIDSQLRSRFYQKNSNRQNTSTTINTQDLIRCTEDRTGYQDKTQNPIVQERRGSETESDYHDVNNDSSQSRGQFQEEDFTFKMKSGQNQNSLQSFQLNGISQNQGQDFFRNPQNYKEHLALIAANEKQKNPNKFQRFWKWFRIPFWMVVTTGITYTGFYLFSPVVQDYTYNTLKGMLASLALKCEPTGNANFAQGFRMSINDTFYQCFLR